MHCLHKSDEVCTQFHEKNSHTFYLAMLGATYICHSSMRQAHNLMKILTSVAKDAWYCLYRLQSLTSYAHNLRKTNYALRHLSMNSKPYVKLALKRMLDTAFISYGVRRGLYKVLWKNQPYTNIVKTCEMHLNHSVHNSRKNELYTYLACEKRPSPFYVLWFLCNVRSNFT